MTSGTSESKVAKVPLSRGALPADDSHCPVLADSSHGDSHVGSVSPAATRTRTLEQGLERGESVRSYFFFSTQGASFLEWDRKKAGTERKGPGRPLVAPSRSAMRLVPATATVAPGLNSVAWASLISAVPRPRPRPQPLMNLFGDIFGGDDMLKAQVACRARARVRVSVRIRVSSPTCSTRRRTSVSARSFLSWSRIRQPLTCCKRSFSH